MEGYSVVAVLIPSLLAIIGWIGFILAALALWESRRMYRELAAAVDHTVEDMKKGITVNVNMDPPTQKGAFDA